MCGIGKRDSQRLIVRVNCNHVKCTGIFNRWYFSRPNHNPDGSLAHRERPLPLAHVLVTTRGRTITGPTFGSCHENREKSDLSSGIGRNGLMFAGDERGISACVEDKHVKKIDTALTQIK